MKKTAMILMFFSGIVFPANQTLVNLPADSWYQVPNSKMDAVCTPGLGGFSCWAVAGAWGGATYDNDDHLMIVWGGGHGDSYDNAVYGFSLTNLTWSRLKDHTGSYLSSDPLPNGDPCSRHTYDGLAYITHAKRFFGYNGAIALSGGASTVVWTLDVAAKRWYNMNASGPKPGQNFGGNGGSIFDPVTKNVFYASTDAVYAYNYDANAWTSWAVLNPQEWGKKRAVLDGKRRILFIFGAKLYAFDLATRQDVSSGWVTTGGSSIFTSGQAAADYDSAADQLVGWAGSGGVYALDMTTKIWIRKSGAGAPASSCGNGTYGRFRYIPEDNVFVLLNANPEYTNGYQNVWFYKHTAGGGTLDAAAAVLTPREISLFPNPVKRNGSVKVGPDGASAFAVYSMDGRKIAGCASGSWKADVAPGLCLIRAGNSTKRLIVLE